ncbi:MAG: hypothetical protein Q4C36_08740 [Coriobacteriia bacterium]|nr:hypothetical protein [Coriobacteriia bacterium]
MEKKGRHAGAIKDSGEDRAFAPKHARMGSAPSQSRPVNLESLPQIALSHEVGTPAAQTPSAAKTGKSSAGKAPQTAWDFAAAGTYVDRSLPKPFAWIVVVLGLVAILLPSIGMAWAFTDSTSENRELAPAPALFGEDGSFNVSILSDAGTWFEDHFAYRNELVSANATLREALGTSPTDQVVVGSEGWLYYGGTLPDYLGQSALSERGLANIAHNLALAQGYVQGHGGTFLLAVAPNKNTLYPEHMPYYYVHDSSPSNYERLKPFLDEAGVRYCDMQAFFADMPDTWYLKTDSHWDNRGALLATNELFAALDRPGIDVDAASAVAREDFLGDLESMLKPAGAQLEANYYYEGYNDGPNGTGTLWSYEASSEQDVTADWIQTQGVSGKGSVLMFRDSFANALVPFWSVSFKDAAFSKLVPYNLPDMNKVKADTVVIERAERHLPYLAENPPIMVSPRVNGKTFAGVEGNPDDPQCILKANNDGPYLVLSGTVRPNAFARDMKIYVSVAPSGQEPAVYDAFWTSIAAEDGSYDDGGYLVRLDGSRFAAGRIDVKVYGVTGGESTCLGDFTDVSVG